MKSFNNYINEVSEAALLESAIVLGYYYSEEEQLKWPALLLLGDSLIEKNLAASPELVKLQTPPPGSEISVNDMKDLIANPKIRLAGAQIAGSLQKQGFKGKAIHFGAGSGTIAPGWLGNDTTAKTDIIIGKHRISLKAGDAQLMTAFREEALSTFLVAVSEASFKGHPLSSELENRITKLIGEFNRGVITNTTGEVLKFVKSGEDFDKIRNPPDIIVIDKAEKLHKELMAVMAEIFSNNIEFKSAMCKEAMTGFHKFGANAPATAEYMLVVNKSGKILSMNQVDDAYARKVAKSSKISIKFKTSSRKAKAALPGERSWWSAFGLNFVAKKITEENEVNESLSDFIIWGKSFFSKAIKTLKKVSADGAKTILNFFNAEPQAVSLKFKVK